MYCDYLLEVCRFIVNHDQEMHNEVRNQNAESHILLRYTFGMEIEQNDECAKQWDEFLSHHSFEKGCGIP